MLLCRSLGPSLVTWKRPSVPLATEGLCLPATLMPGTSNLLSDLAISLGLTLSNTGSAPTFFRGTATSIIDVKFSRGVDMSGWKVMDTVSLSDHAYLSYSITLQHNALDQEDQRPVRLRGWSVRQCDVEALDQLFRSRPLEVPVGGSESNLAQPAARALDNYLEG